MLFSSKLTRLLFVLFWLLLTFYKLSARRKTFLSPFSAFHCLPDWRLCWMVTFTPAKSNRKKMSEKCQLLLWKVSISYWLESHSGFIINHVMSRGFLWPLTLGYLKWEREREDGRVSERRRRRRRGEELSGSVARYSGSVCGSIIVLHHSHAAADSTHLLWTLPRAGGGNTRSITASDWLERPQPWPASRTRDSLRSASSLCWSPGAAVSILSQCWRDASRFSLRMRLWWCGGCFVIVASILDTFD